MRDYVLTVFSVVVERHLHRLHHHLLVLRRRRGALHPARGLWWPVTMMQIEKHHVDIGYRIRVFRVSIRVELLSGLSL